MLQLEMVRAGVDPPLDRDFARSLRQCYGRHGVETAAKAIGGHEREHVHMLVVRDRNGALVGGARVHGRRGRRGFPAEAVLAGFPGARKSVASVTRSGAVELAALWTAPTSKGTGLSRLVAQASIACALAMGKPRAFTFSHQHFEHVLFPVGLRPLPGFSPLPFPNATYRSRIYAVDLGSLATTTTEDRELIRAMATEFEAGVGVLPIRSLTAIEQGRPLLGVHIEPRLRQSA